MATANICSDWRGPGRQFKGQSKDNTVVPVIERADHELLRGAAGEASTRRVTREFF
jgi:hypothetical protein